MVDLTFPFPPHLQVEVEEPVAEVEEESAADIKVRIRAARERALAKPGDRGDAFPEAFSLPRACTQRHSALSDLRPSSPPCTDRNRAFRPPLPPDEPSEALLHSLQRVPQVRALHPLAVDASTRPQITRLLLVAGTPLTNIFPPAPLPFSPSSQVQSAEGRGRRRVREVRQVLPLFVPY